MANRYIQEANAAYERAEKALKTGFTKWTPDYEIAANEYSKAANSFRNAKMSDKFVEAQLKAAKCYEDSRSIFSAAKCYEQVALAARDKEDWNSMIKYIDLSCQYYRENSVPDTAALLYNRSAGMIESAKPEKAAEWYGAASDTTMIEDRYHQAAEYANKAVKIYLKLKQYEKAIDWSAKAMEYISMSGDVRTLSRPVGTMLIVQIAKGDTVAAEKVYNKYRGSIHPDEASVLSQLVRGLDEFDNVAICQALRSPFVDSLDNEIAKIVRDLLVKYQPQTTTAGTTTTSVPVEMTEEEEAASIL